MLPIIITAEDWDGKLPLVDMCQGHVTHLYPSGASDARVLAIVLRLCVCHTLVLYQNG